MVDELLYVKETKVAPDEQSVDKESHDSFVRWQGRTIEQFGYALNLILGLSVAGLGLEVSLLLNKKFAHVAWQNCLFIISMLSMLLSVAAGLWCVINRLRDFRATTKTAREREKGAPDLELQPLRMFTRTLGDRTWLLFWWQISSFAVGIILLVAAVGER